jgi:hypothetical protein
MNLGAAVLTRAAAWIAAAGAHSVAQLEPDDIDGAPCCSPSSHGCHYGLQMHGPEGLVWCVSLFVCLCVCLCVYLFV